MIDYSESKKVWIPVSQWSEVGFHWPTIGALRRYNAQKHKLGLEDCFAKNGNQILIQPATFFELIVQRGPDAKTLKGQRARAAHARSTIVAA